MVGSGEFLPAMEAVDKELLAGRPLRVAVIPTASAPEGPGRLSYWLDLARRHYDKLGVQSVDVPVFDRTDADAPELAARIDEVGMVYLSGGNPHFLASTLRATKVWDAVLTAWHGGAALAGCSAGAMALTSGAPPGLRPVGAGAVGAVGAAGATDAAPGPANGLGVIDTLAVIPHYDQMERWRPGAGELWAQWKPAGTTLVGIDEETAILTTSAGWQVRGAQGVWVIDHGSRRRFSAGDTVLEGVPAEW